MGVGRRSFWFFFCRQKKKDKKIIEKPFLLVITTKEKFHFRLFCILNKKGNNKIVKNPQKNRP